MNGVRIIAADVFDWNIATDMLNDKALNDAVYAMGIHYNERWEKEPYSTSEIAKNLNKSIRNSEGGPWKGDWDGFEYLVKLYNRNYIVGKSTNVVTWSLITSYYDNLSLPNSGLMTSKGHGVDITKFNPVSGQLHIPRNLLSLVGSISIRVAVFLKKEAMSP